MSSAITAVRTEILADQSNPQLLVHVKSDDGSSGVGETWWGTYQPLSEPGAPVRPIAAMIDEVLGPLCIGWDSDDIKGLWEKLYRASYQYGPEGLVSTAISGIDLALWDLVGRRRDLPVADLLGSRCHDRIPAYASLHWLGTPELASRDAVDAVAAGFVGVKLHEAEVEVILAVRDAIGPNVALMVDLSARLEESTTVELSADLKNADITWLEEPIFPYQDHSTLAKIRASIPQRLAAGENEFSSAGFERLLNAEAVDVVQPDIVKAGGLTPARAISDLASSKGAWLCPHNFSIGPSLGANIHWAMTATAAKWIEVPFLSSGQSFPGSWARPTLVDGSIPYPTEPGLGWG